MSKTKTGVKRPISRGPYLAGEEAAHRALIREVRSRHHHVSAFERAVRRLGLETERSGRTLWVCYSRGGYDRGGMPVSSTWAGFDFDESGLLDPELLG